MGITRATREVKTVTIEYDRNGKRVRKSFDSVTASRAFYSAKMRAGRNPRIVAASR